MKFKFLPILMLIASASFYAQVTPTQGNNQETKSVLAEAPISDYILKDIVVDGIKKYTPAQILKFTGLLKNEKIYFGLNRWNYANAK